MMVESTDELFRGPGEMRALCRATDWSATSLGPVEGWSSVLRMVLRNCLESPFPISLWCGPDRVLIYNDAYRRVLGAKHPDALGRPGASVWSEIWPEISSMFEAIEAGGEPFFREDAPFVVDRMDGAEHRPRGDAEPNAWFTFSLSAVRDDECRIVAFLNIVAESTARVLAERDLVRALDATERAEAHLRDVFAQAPAFLAVLRGEDHVFEYVNAAYYQLVGHRRLIGLPLVEALPEIRDQGFPELLTRVFTTGEPYIGQEVPALISRTADAAPEQRYVDLVYYPIRHPDGTPSGVVAHGSDVTEHVVARHEALHAREEAERANQAKSTFLAMMSHEIRTPINAVVGYTDLLEAGVGGTLTDLQRGYMSRIRSSTQHLLGIVNSVLDLAKIEAGEMSVQREETGIAAVMRAAMEMVLPQAEAIGIELREVWECETRPTFIGDEDRARQILLNLLSNALKFTLPGGKVTVRCRVLEGSVEEGLAPRAGSWLVIEVEDTGVGIPEDQLDRIFEPFVQAETGHTRRAGGTGLGLTISRRFARLMGGDLTVRSAMGTGSCFSLWLTPLETGRPLPAADERERFLSRPDLPGLTAVGRILISFAGAMEDELVGRMRTDAGLAVSEAIPREQLAHHTAAFVTALGTTLTALGAGREERVLLEDAEEVRHLLASRLGRHRRRLGWSAGQIRREYGILHEVVDVVVRREAPARTDADLEYLLGILHRLLDRAVEVSAVALEGMEGERVEEG